MAEFNPDILYNIAVNIFTLSTQDVSFNYNALTVTLPFTLALLGHVWNVAGIVRTNNPNITKVPSLQAIFACTVCAMGGSTLSALVLGVPPGWMAKDNVFLFTLVSIWLMLYCPFDLCFRLYQSLQPIFTVFASFAWGSSIVAGIELSYSVAPRSHCLALLCGVLSGCAGGIVVESMGLAQSKWELKVPSALVGSSARFSRTFVLALLYQGMSIYKMLSVSTLKPMIAWAAVIIAFLPISPPPLPPKKHKKQ